MPEELDTPIVSEQGKGKARGAWTKVKGKQASTSRAPQKRKRTQSPAVSASKQVNPPPSKFTKKAKAAAKLELEKQRKVAKLAKTPKEVLRSVRFDKLSILDRQKRTKAEIDKLMISYARLSSKLAISIKEQTGTCLPPPFIALSSEMLEAASVELAKAGTPAQSASGSSELTRARA